LQANLVGIILLGAAVTQVALAAWYFIIDGIMLVQLLFYGHDDLRKYGRPPRKASALARIHERGHLGQSLTRQFEEFSPWDDVKLLGFCVAGGIAAWGIYMTLGLYANPETFAIKIPEGFHPLSFGAQSFIFYDCGCTGPMDAMMRQGSGWPQLRSSPPLAFPRFGPAISVRSGERSLSTP
jgi:hypothetical protein